MLIYSEKFDKENVITPVFIGAVIFLISLLILSFVLLGFVLTGNYFILMFVSAILALVLYGLRGHMTLKDIHVDYTSNDIVIRNGIEKRIPYSVIEAVWVGMYAGNQRFGTVAENKLENSLPIHGLWNTRAEILVWNLQNSLLGTHKKEIILKRSDQTRLSVLHTKDQPRVMALLKEQAKQARFIDS